MAKDPAFLFYSKDFYEGTRMMLPEERACYVDLMVYQHQNGVIPNDIKRLMMYCSGVDEATLKATLKAKFKLSDKGWVNQKLSKVISERSDYKNKQSVNGTIGQFWKKCKANLSNSEYKKLRSDLVNVEKDKLFDFLESNKIEKQTLKGSLKALLKHLVIEDVIVNEDENKDEILEVEIFPSFEDFWNAYDKKVGKKETIKSKWQKLPQNTKEKIITYIDDYKLAQPDKQYRKNPETFLNNESWNDEIIIPNNNAKPVTVNRQTEQTYIRNGQGW